MLYWLSRVLYSYDVPGTRLFQYISFRTGVAFVLALLLALWWGKYLVRWLRSHQVRDEERQLGLAGEQSKSGTPTMGGVLIVACTVVPLLLMANLRNAYLWIMLGSTFWFGLLGGIDDYIKVYRKDKRGVNGWVKVAMQVVLGLFVGVMLYLSPQTEVRQGEWTRSVGAETCEVAAVETQGKEVTSPAAEVQTPGVKSLQTTIPFVKNNQFDYRCLVPIQGKVGNALAWALFVLVVAFIVTAVSNGANLTDGLDGLATGVSVPVVVVLGLFAYLSGNVIYSSYLNIMYMPNLGELVVFMGAFLGALVGFLWYNCYPAQVFMGDTGSLTIGGVIGVYAVLIRKELLLPLLCGVFLMETVSVALQRGYFKYTKRRYGEGRRIFKMAPLHHHYQKLGMPEPRIVVRFWIVGIILATLTVVTLKIR